MREHATELIVGGERPERWASVKIGSVRLTERLLPSDPPTPAEQQIAGVVVLTGDVRSAPFEAQFREHLIDTVVHLASIVTPGKDSSREFEYSVDVGGTRNVLQACVAQGVRHVVVSSSGAAYGYHADNPEWLSENHPLRGNEGFAYSHHKRLFV